MPMRRPGTPKRDPAHRRRHFLKEWREFRGLTQAELGNKVKTTGATISRIENLDHGYQQDTLEPIADELGVHPGILLTRAPSPDLDGPPARPPRKSRRSR